MIERSKRIRARYHELEVTHHGTEWSVEEDALAFLSDAGLVGRLAMLQQGPGAYHFSIKLLLSPYLTNFFSSPNGFLCQ